LKFSDAVLWVLRYNSLDLYCEGKHCYSFSFTGILILSIAGLKSSALFIQLITSGVFSFGELEVLQ